MADDGLAVVTRLAERTMKANWAALLAAVPDMRADLVRATQQGETVWSERHWWGTLESGDPFELRGIALFDVHEGLVVSGRLFTELVEHEGMDIAESVEAQSGRRPELEPD